MANTINNFLIGIGYDYDQKGQKNAESGINSIKTTALQAGAAIGAVFGAKQLTFGFAEAADEIGKFGEVFDVAAGDVSALGRALEYEGGTLQSFMSQLEGIQRLRSLTPDRIGALFQQAGIVGVDPNLILGAENATEAYINLARVLDDVSPEKRLQIADVFGLDEASIRLLSQGEESVRALVERQKEIRPVTEQMTQVAAGFNDSITRSSNTIGGFADRISTRLLPNLTDATNGMSDFLDVNRELINSGIDSAFDVIDENFESIAASATLLGASGALGVFAGMAKHVPKIGGGISVIAGGLARLTAVTGLLALVPTAAEATDKSLRKIFGEKYEAFDIALTKGIYDLTGYDGSRGGVYNGTERDPIINLPDPPTEISAYATGTLAAPPRVSYGTQRPESAPTQTRQRETQRPINVDVNVTLDGQALNNKIETVVEQQYESAFNDINTSTEG